jgi:SAM-dependent methyltransferase
MEEREMWELFWEIHSDNPREGPGEFQSTKRAFDMLKDLPSNPRILDIGCGPGMQTVDLSRLTDGTITAIDNHQQFLEDLGKKVEHNGLNDRITTHLGDMRDLHFEEGTFDIIWAEGSIYVIGFEKGFLQWRLLLKDGGYLVASELTWLRADAPKEVQDYFIKEYPGMQDIEGNLRTIQKAGYRHIGHFVLPESAWWFYYSPIEEKISQLRQKYEGLPEALAVLEDHQREIDIFRRYSEYYGFVFYVAQIYPG